MLSDDDLAKIAHQARQKGRFAPTWDELTVKWPWEQEEYRRIARALRAALLPEVAPLRPGETVMIPDRWWLPTDTVYAGLTLNESECYPDLSVIADDGEVGVRVRLDAAGVAALKLACARWQAAQGGEQ